MLGVSEPRDPRLSYANIPNSAVVHLPPKIGISLFGERHCCIERLLCRQPPLGVLNTADRVTTTCFTSFLASVAMGAPLRPGFADASGSMQQCQPRYAAWWPPRPGGARARRPPRASRMRARIALTPNASGGQGTPTSRTVKTTSSLKSWKTQPIERRRRAPSRRRGG